MQWNFFDTRKISNNYKESGTTHICIYSTDILVGNTKRFNNHWGVKGKCILSRAKWIVFLLLKRLLIALYYILKCILKNTSKALYMPSWRFCLFMLMRDVLMSKLRRISTIKFTKGPTVCHHWKNTFCHKTQLKH